MIFFFISLPFFFCFIFSIDFTLRNFIIRGDYEILIKLDEIYVSIYKFKKFELNKSNGSFKFHFKRLTERDWSDTLKPLRRPPTISRQCGSRNLSLKVIGAPQGQGLFARAPISILANFTLFSPSLLSGSYRWYYNDVF